MLFSLVYMKTLERILVQQKSDKNAIKKRKCIQMLQRVIRYMN